MKLNLTRKGLGIILGLSLASGAAFASTIGGGEFSASGTVFVSASALDFGTSSLPPPGDQHASINLPTTGAFSYLTFGTLIGMNNLNLTAATVTPTDINFDGAVPAFITLPADSTGSAIDLSLTDIPINTGVPVCTDTAADNVLGTSCRAYATSPIVLEQGPSGVTAILNLQGDAYYATGGSPATGSPYDGKLSADFTGANGTITGLLGNFNSTGSVTTGFTATFSTVPEPGTVTALGVGLLAIGLFNKKKRASKKSV